VPERQLLDYVRPYWAIVVAALVASAITSVLDGFTFALLIPFLRALFGEGIPATPTMLERVMANLTGGAVQVGSPEVVLRVTILSIVGTIVVKNVTGYIATCLNAQVEANVARDLRCDLHDHLMRVQLGFFSSTRSGRLVNAMFADVDQAKTLVQSGLQVAVRNGMVLVVYAVILFSLSWRLAVLTFILMPAAALFLKPILTGVRKRSAVALESRGDVASRFTETISAARLVKSHAAEPEEKRRFNGLLNRYVSEHLRAERWALLASPLGETVGAGVFVVLLVVGAAASLHGGTIRPEVFMAFLAVTLRLLPPLKKLIHLPAVAAQAGTAAHRVFEILDETAERDAPGARVFPGFREEIRFAGVWFRYAKGEWVLRGVDLCLNKGEVVAVVGRTGAGKSTLADLVPRFVDPTRGQVLIDGVSTTCYNRRSLRAAIAIVGQETLIFHDTVQANIAYGTPPDTSRSAIEAAARAANAHAFIERLPLGYQTIVGERGLHLSGGERQRIAIARALLRDAPILILDEATSALDSDTDRLVQEAIGRLLDGRTVLLIAHRLSTVARAQRIAVLHEGRIVEIGRHADLLAKRGLYQRLHDVAIAR
jgi:ATP-binding cassette, subfamily B, bacterial MsbA